MINQFAHFPIVDTSIKMGELTMFLVIDVFSFNDISSSELSFDKVPMLDLHFPISIELISIFDCILSFAILLALGEVT